MTGSPQAAAAIRMATPVGADPFQVTSKTFVETRSKPTGLNVGATPPQMDTEGRAGAEVT